MKYLLFIIGVFMGSVFTGYLEAQQQPECLNTWQLEYEHDPLYSDHYINEIMPNQFK